MKDKYYPFSEELIRQKAIELHAYIEAEIIKKITANESKNHTV